MRTQNIILIACGLLIIPYYSNAATTCSRANLTRCLDSVCAINVGANPAARCQYCGTSDAGTPPANGMRSVSAGASAKYTLSDKELKSAPTDAGSRYAWATAQCIKKVSGCTPDDVTDTYDSLIEQSCKAAGIDAQLASVRAENAKKPTKTSCTTTIRSCLVAATRCNYDYQLCKEDSDFDKFFSECGVSATGCDAYASAIKTDLIAARDTAIANADTVVDGLVAAYKSARESRLESILNGCKNNATRDACVTSVCENNMNNKCATGYEAEKSMAIQLCKFYEIACNQIK